MLGLALSVGASGVFTTQSEASAAISIPQASATDQAFSSDSEVSAPALSTSPAQVVAYHTVASGQSLWQIAQLHRVGLQDLKAANQLPIETSIRVGQVLKVPSSEAAAQSPAQQAIQNLATRSTEPETLVATSNLALQSVETVAKAKISEQSQSRQSQTTEGLEASEEVDQQEVPTLDEVQVSIEIASADVGSSEQISAQVDINPDKAQATFPADEVLPVASSTADPVENPVASPPAAIEFDIADASLAERATADSTPVVTALAAPAQRFDSYQIQAGDTIANIAASLGTTAAELISVNDLTDPNVIMTGATLIVPTVDSGKAARQLNQPAGNTIERPSQNSRLSRLQRTAIRQNESSAVEQSGSTNQQTASAEREQSIAAQGGVDPHVANLLEEVQEIQSEPVRIAEAEITQVEEVSPSPRIAERVAIAPTQTNEAESAIDPSLLAVAPLSPDAYIPAQRSPAGQLVSPDMPLLPEADEFLPEAPDYFNGYIWPTRGTFTSGYGWRWGRMHRGVDVAGPVGTPIVAAASGVVERAGWNSGGYGNLVEIRHPDGSLTLYAHNNRLSVSTGQAVKQGQKIAEMGSTGYSTGPHLHFEVHLSGKGAVNPVAHLPRR